MVLLALATEVLHWRANAAPGGPYDVLRDSLLVLTVSGVSVWCIVNGLHRPSKPIWRRPCTS